MTEFKPEYVRHCGFPEPFVLLADVPIPLSHASRQYIVDALMLKHGAPTASDEEIVDRSK